MAERVGILMPALNDSKAGNGARTRDPQLGKLMLYQLSYSRVNTPEGYPQASKVSR
jgi:hypothetical protein